VGTVGIPPISTVPAFNKTTSSRFTSHREITMQFEYTEDEQRAMKNQLILALAGFITTKLIITYVIHKAAKAAQ
jgi:hypothetical protein